MAPESYEAKPLPRQLKDQVQIYFEEQLYTFGLTLLNNVLASGASSEQCSCEPRPVPPPQFLGFICNLIVHPRTTSRADTLEARHAATQAQVYLENLLHMVGPIGSRFSQAFRFKPQNNRRQRGAFVPESTSGSSDLDEDDAVGGTTATLWTSSPDFWSVVGWALNCSVAHPGRWEYWHPWLELMIDIILEDWYYYCDASVEFDHEVRMEILRRSMLLMYISDKGGRNSNGFKWVRKAIFADGKGGSASIFQEVFPNETKGVSRPQTKRKRNQTMELGKNQFGDYDSDENCDLSMMESDTINPLDDGSESFDNSELDKEEVDLYIESIPVRIKLISMLSHAAAILETEFVSVDSFYEDICREMRQHPFAIFQVFVSFTATSMQFPQYIYMMRELFDQLLPPNCMQPSDIDEAAEVAGSITQEILEECYLQQPAATVTYRDNAQLQLLCEQTIIALNSERMVFCTQSLLQAAEKGTAVRMKRVKHPRGHKRGLSMSDQAAKEYLEQAPARMKFILENIDKEKATTHE